VTYSAQAKGSRTPTGFTGQIFPKSLLPSVNKGQQALQQSFPVLLRLSSLPGVSPSVSSARKIPRKIFAGRREAVSPEQKSAQAMKRPQRIRAVLSRALKQDGRFSAR